MAATRASTGASGAGWCGVVVVVMIVIMWDRLRRSPLLLEVAVPEVDVDDLAVGAALAPQLACREAH